MNCPSRRQSIAYPRNCFNAFNSAPRPAARTDYAVNCGDSNPVHSLVFGSSPGSIAEAEDPNFNWPDTSPITGISFVRSEVSFKRITDRTTKVYLVGEVRLSQTDMSNLRV